ncbi:phosphate acyltransferase [Amylibacter sp.]|nr:phosphate acyltransferase [Amylibacter sp.]
MNNENKFISGADPICPADFLTRAKLGKVPRVAIASAGAALPMLAAYEATNEGIMTPIFVGEADDINLEASKLSWDISNYKIINANGETEAASISANLCGVGEADVLMKGQLHTDVFMKAALNRDAGLRIGSKFVHLFAMSHPEGGPPIVISDAAVNVNPDIETRKDATISVVKLLNALGIKHPKIAFLSATESVIPSVLSSIEGAELSKWAKQQIPDAYFSGPLALDLILSKKSKVIKGLKDDPVAGFANGIIVPEIVSGNTLFKSMVYMTGACAGGIVVGGKVPILLTSRADSSAARLSSISLASIWSNAN